MSSCPNSLPTRSTLCSIARISCRSTSMGMHPEPIWATADCKVARLRPVMATLAPSFANRRAVARPIPLLPPVMSAVLPLSFMRHLLQFYARRGSHGPGGSARSAAHFNRGHPRGRVGKNLRPDTAQRTAAEYGFQHPDDRQLTLAAELPVAVRVFP